MWSLVDVLAGTRSSHGGAVGSSTFAAAEAPPSDSLFKSDDEAVACQKAEDEAQRQLTALPGGLEAAALLQTPGPEGVALALAAVVALPNSGLVVRAVRDVFAWRCHAVSSNYADVKEVAGAHGVTTMNDLSLLLHSYRQAVQPHSRTPWLSRAQASRRRRPRRERPDCAAPRTRNAECNERSIPIHKTLL